MTHTSLSLAFWFVNPALLGGLGFVALPILIHLFSRRRFRRIEWGAMRFLLEAEKENRRRLRVEQWLLIALRCLALALLALLLARPFVQPGLVASLLGGQGRVQRVILLDDSASLAFRSGMKADFAALREAAERLLGWLHAGARGDPVSVYLTSRPDAPLVCGQPLTAAALDDLLARVRGLEPVDLMAQPRRVLETIAGELLADGSVARADLYVLSDFQRSEWLAFDAADAGVFEPLHRLDPRNLRVALIATGGADRANAAILAAQLERPQTIAGLPAVVHATVANYARAALEGARVQVEVDGAPLPPVPVEMVAPGKTRTVSVEVTFPDEGFSELTVGVDVVDGLSADDTRRLALPVKRSLETLLVNGQPATDPVRDEVYYLQNALAPAGQFASGIRVRTIDPSEIEATALDAFDGVLMCNVAVPGPGAVAALQRYVRKGGGLVFFLGEEVGDPDEYNRVFYAAGQGLLPLPLQELRRREPTKDAPGLVRSEDHPVTMMFPADAGALPGGVRFHTYYRCAEPDVTDSPDATRPPESDAGAQPAAARPSPVVLARFTDEAQTPALAERSFGRGRVLLFASSVDPDWNDWARAIDGSYVVTLLELVQYTSRRDSSRLWFATGEDLVLSLPPDEYEPGAVFRSPIFPDEPAVEARLRESTAALGEPIVLEGPAATRLGLYMAELTRRTGSVEVRPLAVNLAAGESDLAVAPARELGAALGEIPHEYVQAADAFVEGAPAARRELWPAFLVALLVTLMLEHTLAWWFGVPGGSVRFDLRTLPVLRRFRVGAE